MINPRLGEIYWVNLDPTIGSEICKKRPAIIVSNDAANRRFRQVTVVPLTSKNLVVAGPFQVALSAADTGLKTNSKALAEQIRTVAKERLGTIIGSIGGEQLQAVVEAIKIHLALD